MIRGAVKFTGGDAVNAGVTFDEAVQPPVMRGGDAGGVATGWKTPADVIKVLRGDE